MLVRIPVIIVSLVLCFSSAALCDTPPGPGSGNDPIANALVPPDLVMAHQQELSLTESQRAAIQADMQRAQTRFMSLQWQLSAAVEKLASMLAQPRVDETQALAQLDRELVLEHDIKRTQLQLMIQIKNELTQEQQANLTRLKHAHDH